MKQRVHHDGGPELNAVLQENRIEREVEKADDCNEEDNTAVKQSFLEL